MVGVKEGATEGGGGIGGNWNGGGGIRPAKGLKARPGGTKGGGPATCEAEGPTDEGEPQAEFTLGGGVV